MYLNRHRLGTALLLSVLVAGFVAPAMAATDAASKPDTQELPQVLQKAVKSGKLKVVKRFDTAKSGLKGYVIKQSGQYQVVYGEGDYLMVGQLISPDGDNLSATYTDKYVPKPDLAKTISQLKKEGHLVQQGPDDAPVLYAFADPNCIYCHHFYQAVAPLAKAGKLQIQWALVGFLKPSSMGRAAAILSAKDPAAAMAENEAGFNEDKEEGGIKPVDSPDPALKKLIQQHGKDMAEAGGRGTPTIIYREGANKWGMKPGMPPKSWLKDYAKGDQAE